MDAPRFGCARRTTIRKVVIRFMLLRLSSEHGCIECRLGYARKHYLGHIPTWKIKAAIWQQKKPVINGWLVEVIK